MAADSVEAVSAALRLSDAEEQLCRCVARTRLVLSAAELIVTLGLLVGLTFTGGAAALLSLTHPPGAPEWLGHLLFLLCLGVLARASAFPFQLLQEHWLERRSGTSRQSLAGWLWEWSCRTGIFGAATALVLLPVAETLRWWPWMILPWCAGFLLLRGLFFDYLYHPLLVCFYPVHFLRHESFALPGIGKVTLPVYQVRVSHKTRRANASIRFRGSKTAIYVTDTLLDEFTDGEERVVMAHEFGHLYDRLHLEARTRAGVAQAHRKLMLGTAQLLAAVVSLFLVHELAGPLGLRGAHDLAGFPLLAALTFGLATLFTPLLCAESRRDERDADEYALAITGDVESYVSVMRKLRRLNLEESGPGPLGYPLFDTHPSYAERVRLALEYRRRFPPRRKPKAWRGWRNIQRHGRR